MTTPSNTQTHDGPGNYRTHLDTRNDTRYQSHVYYNKPYRDAVALQKLINQSAPKAEPRDLASLAKSFAALEMLKLRIRMKPAPKPVDVSKAKDKPRVFVEPEE